VRLPEDREQSVNARTHHLDVRVQLKPSIVQSEAQGSPGVNVGSAVFLELSNNPIKLVCFRVNCWRQSANHARIFGPSLSAAVAANSGAVMANELDTATMRLCHPLA